MLGISRSPIKDFEAKRQAREILMAFFAIFILVTVGTTGYSVIEGWEILDSLYMTVITLSTVGFSEIQPLSPAGRAFTIVLICIGVGVVMFVLSTSASIIIGRQVSWIFERRSMKNIIEALEGHTIFCGFGRISRFAVEHLVSQDEDVVVIDWAESAIEVANEAGIPAIKGDALDDDVLLAAGLNRAKRLVCLLPKDADNLYVIMTCKEFNPDIYIISRAEEEPGEKRMKRAGAERIISPYRVGGEKVAEGILRPHVTEFLDIAGPDTKSGLQIEEIRVPDESPIVGRTLLESKLRSKTNIIVAAIISPDGEMHFNPSGETEINAGSTLIGFGDKKDFLELLKLIAGPES